MSQAEISSGSAGRPNPIFAGFSAALAVAIARTPITTNATGLLAELDILDLAIAAHQPALDAVIVVDRVDAANLAQFLFARLHIAGGIDGARLHHQFLAVPIEVEIKARHRLVEH